MLNRKLSNLFRVPTSAQTYSNTLINDDIRPLPLHRRTWTTITYVSWWSIWVMGLSNFQLGSSLVAIGLSVWQTMIAVILGRIIIAAVAVLNGYPGAEWHIGFPVFSRVIWGIYGSYMAVVLRIILGIVGFAVQSYLGGLCVTALLSGMFSSFNSMPNHFPLSAHITTAELVGWLVFNFISIPLIWVRPEKAGRPMIIMNSITIVTLLSILIWSLTEAGGAGPLLSQPGSIQSSSQLGWTVVGGVMNVVGSIAPGLLSQPDFSRFARRPKDQVFGQWFTFIFIGTIMPFFGCLVSSATQGIYGQPIWNPPVLILTWLRTEYNSKSRAAAVFAGLGVGVSQMAVIVVDNAYSVGLDLSGLFPMFINVRRGAYIGLILSMAMCPWELMTTAAVFLTVISSFTVFFGPICGIHICDYWILRRRRIKLSDLYHTQEGGIYYYWRGVNWRSFVSWVVGWAPLLPGLINLVNPSIPVSVGATRLYSLSFVLGFCLSFVTHLGLNKIFPPPGLQDYDKVDTFGTFAPDEAEKLGVVVSEDADSSSAGDASSSQETKV